MNNDLISREALKENEPHYDEEGYRVFYESEIDNAPTVPQDCSDCKRFDFPFCEIKFDKEQMQELVDKAKAEVLASIERPQGKWITKYDKLECPFCGMSIDDEVHWLYSEEFNFNFCPNCGADMRGGKE